MTDNILQDGNSHSEDANCWITNLKAPGWENQPLDLTVLWQHKFRWATCSPFRFSSHPLSSWQPPVKREPDERDGHWISVSPHHHCSDTYLWALMGFSLLATVLTSWHGFCLDNVSRPPPRRWRTCYRGCSTCFYPPCRHHFPVRETDEENIRESPKASEVFVPFRSVARETRHRLSSWNVCVVFALQSLFSSPW